MKKKTIEPSDKGKQVMAWNGESVWTYGWRDILKVNDDTFEIQTSGGVYLLLPLEKEGIEWELK